MKDFNSRKQVKLFIPVQKSGIVQWPALSLAFLILLLLHLDVSASFPTNTSVTATTDPPTGQSRQVVLSAFDAQRNQTVTWRSNYGAHSNPSAHNGVIVWGTTVGSEYPSPLTWSFAIYDPKCGCWKVLTTPTFYNDSLTLAYGGVIGWNTISYASGTFPPYVENHFAVYNPEVSAWVVSSSPSSQRNTGGFVASDTMVAWGEIIYGPFPNDPPRIVFHFSIYDPTRNQWRATSTNSFIAHNSSYGIIDGTGRYIVQGITYKVGYNYVTGNWVQGSDTVPLSYFVPTSTTGHAPL